MRNVLSSKMGLLFALLLHLLPCFSAFTFMYVCGSGYLSLYLSPGMPLCASESKFVDYIWGVRLEIRHAMFRLGYGGGVATQVVSIIHVDD